MTCASCAARIEKRLNKLDGVDATVNFATEQAAVTCVPASPSTRSSTLCATQDTTPARPFPADAHHTTSPRDPCAGVSWCAIALSVPVRAPRDGASGPVLELGVGCVRAGDSRRLLVGLGFHRAALRAARHASASMDTLISMGTLAAWIWSTVVLAFGLDADTYFELSTAFTTLILLGRYLETRAKGRSNAAIRRLLELGCQGCACAAGTAGGPLVPVATLRVGDLFVVRPGRRSRPTVSSSRGTRPSISRC
jgi:Cu+-exporting ATPase